MACSSIETFFSSIKSKCHCCCGSQNEVSQVEDDENNSFLQFFLCFKEYMEPEIDLNERGIEIVRRDGNFLDTEHDRSNILEITSIYMRTYGLERDLFEVFSRVNIAAKLVGIDLSRSYFDHISVPVHVDYNITREIERIKQIGSKASFFFSYLKRFNLSAEVMAGDLYEWRIIFDSQIQMLYQKENEDADFFNRIKRVKKFVDLNLEDINFFLEMSSHFLPVYSSFHSWTKENKKDNQGSSIVLIPGITISSDELETVLKSPTEVIPNLGISPERLDHLKPYVRSLFSFLKNTTSKRVLKERYFLSEKVINKISSVLLETPTFFDALRDVESVEDLNEETLGYLYRIADSNFFKSISGNKHTGSYNLEECAIFERDESLSFSEAESRLQIRASAMF